MAVSLKASSAMMDFVLKDSVNATIYSIANTVYILENLIKLEKEFPYEVDVEIYMDLEDKKKKAISKLMNILIQDVLCEDVKFNLIKKKLSETKSEKKLSPIKNVCLFSGGVDSTTGILKSLEYYGEVIGLYVAHRFTGKIDRKVMDLNKLLLKPRGIQLEKFLAPEWRQGYSQTRGFLYLLYAGVLANMVSAERIIISECGQTMFQPKFVPFDTITYTTHPYVLQIAKKVIDLILDKDIDIITPFEDFTKSELIKVMPDDSILSTTHSCVTGRWQNNCGKCYACITRMIGSINNQLSLSYFRDNVFEIEDNEALCALLNFCYDFMYSKDDVDFWSLRSIENFGKDELFERVADEIFLALNTLKEQDLLHANYEFILDDFMESNGKRIIERKFNLKTLKHPNFNKKVSHYLLK